MCYLVNFWTGVGHYIHHSILIGSDARNTIVLEDDGVADVHLHIWVTPDNRLFVTTHSHKRVFIVDQWIEEAGRSFVMRPGNLLAFGRGLNSGIYVLSKHNFGPNI